MYSNRIDNYPDTRYIKEQSGDDKYFWKYFESKNDNISDQCLNPLPFFSQIHTIILKPEMIEQLVTAEWIERIPIDTLNQWLHECCDISLLRYGDTIWYSVGKNDFKEYNERVVIWDGSSVVYLDDTVDDYGHVPKQFDVAKFPTVDYFDYSITGNTLVWLHNNVEIKLLKHVGKMSKWIRADGMILCTFIENFENYYKNNKETLCDFSVDSFYDYLNNLGIEDEKYHDFENDHDASMKENARILFVFWTKNENEKTNDKEITTFGFFDDNEEPGEILNTDVIRQITSGDSFTARPLQTL